MHCLTKNRKKEIQKSLLKWYKLNQRTLPWRSIAASEDDLNAKAYAVWVSEIMLQQTQVATVIKYFNEWINKWPTVTALAKASLEEVNTTWAGLGYYSRAKRLHEGAIKITDVLNGDFPEGRKCLEKELPGVGRYTASAIASIAMEEPVGVVDGNVIRVLTRLCAIGGDISSQVIIDELWKLADEVVTTEKPGDFNQAIMELGALVCTPKNPSCVSCPLRENCVAYALSEQTLPKGSVATAFTKKDKKPALVDIECVPNCDLCLKMCDWEISAGVKNFPRKRRKTLVKKKMSGVVVVRDEETSPTTFLLVQRPNKGLLANLWEFLSISLVDEEEEGPLEATSGEELSLKLMKEKLNQFELPESLGEKLNYVGDVTHIFSHIHQTYKVYESRMENHWVVSMPENYQGSKWMSEEEFLSCATSTAMKKVFKSYTSSYTNGKKRTKELKNVVDKRQRKLSHFFLPAQ